MDFIKYLSLDIKLNWSIIDGAKRLFEPLLNMDKDKMNFTDELSKSFELENSNLTQNIVSNLIKYDGNSIEDIFKILIENKLPFKRAERVYVKNTFGDILHIGLPQSKIDYAQLQIWYDTFMTWKFNTPVEKSFCGFLLYLLYVRIHPHIDGNGRTGRYLFLENKLLEGTENYFPLSSILQSRIFIDIYDEMNSIFKLMDITNKSTNPEDYFKLILPDKYVKRMLHIMYCSILYKHLKVNDIKQCQEYEEWDSFGEMICKYKSPFAGHTFIESDETIVTKMKEFLKKYVDLDKHVKVLKVLNV